MQKYRLIINFIFTAYSQLSAKTLSGEVISTDPVDMIENGFNLLLSLLDVLPVVVVSWGGLVHPFQQQGIPAHKLSHRRGPTDTQSVFLK